jgi:AmmeMemoRadiSam system protein B/AmmeMemoRadiSam system protein A
MPVSKNLLILIIAVSVALIVSMIIIKKSQNKIEPVATKSIRKSAVAGSFYPADKQELSDQLDVFFKKTKIAEVLGKPRILIVPHAGIIYSGQVAAWGFKQIEGKDYSRIILLGGSHQAWFNHAAIDNEGLWQTPLGQVKIDEDFANSIIDKKDNIIADKNPFANEHSLEMELIFLQKVLKNFTIVPVLVSNPSEQLIASLAEKINRLVDDQTLLVISSDLSHYPPYESANQADEEIINSILSGNQETFDKTVKMVESKNYPGLETAACGREAIKVALKTAELLKIKNFKKIQYENSGSISGDKSRVVGYVSIIASGDKLPTSSNLLDEEAQKEALEIARQTLDDFLNNKIIPNISPRSQNLLQPLGAFVTLRNKKQLRGCIGEFEPTDRLYKVVQKMVLAAATKDMRFMPIEKSELKDIKIEISVMTPKRKINDWQQIQLGKHGVVVQKGLNAGTFLPQVASETSWSKKEFLSHLCSEKAGLPSNCYQDPNVNLYIFEAQVFEEE